METQCETVSFVRAAKWFSHTSECWRTVTVGRQQHSDCGIHFERLSHSGTAGTTCVDVAALNTGAKPKQTVLPWRQNTWEADNGDNLVESMCSAFLFSCLFLFFLLFALQLQQRCRPTAQRRPSAVMFTDSRRPRSGVFYLERISLHVNKKNAVSQ